MDDSFKERRKFLRIYRNFILSYHEKGKGLLTHEVSQVNNVSRGGMNFSSTRSLKEGLVLDLDLKTPFMAGSIQLEGVVLGCKEKIPDLIYEVRVQFQEIPPQAVAVLEKIENYGKDTEEQI